MQSHESGRTFSQEEQDEVAAGLKDFSASELQLLEKMLKEEEQDRVSSSSKLLTRSRSERSKKPKKKRSMSLAPSESLAVPVLDSPEMPVSETAVYQHSFDQQKEPLLATLCTNDLC
jgi:hypothetical protein